jgi:3-hydroxyisobutyrate dehydrogenase
MTAGERFGIAPETLLAIINGSSGRSGSTENKWPNFILTGRYDSGFAAGLMFKDMRIATDLAHTLGTPTTLSDAAVAAWEQAVADLGAAADHTAVARWISGEEGGAMAR